MLVAILRVPAPPSAEAAVAMERRFAERLPLVQNAPGFLSFELLRPVGGTGLYLSISRWRSRDDFDDWASSAANTKAHGRPEPEGGPPCAHPAGTDGAVPAHGTTAGADRG